MSKCECALQTSLVGDGCRYCNPQYYIDMLKEQQTEMETDVTLAIEELLLTNDEHAKKAIEILGGC